MKRIVKSFAIAAVSALAFISCSQEQNPVSQENGIHFTIRTSENPQVKSFIESDFEGRYIPKWSKGDELAMFVGTINDKSKPTATLTNSNETARLPESKETEHLNPSHQPEHLQRVIQMATLA